MNIVGKYYLILLRIRVLYGGIYSRLV